ncbi:5-methylcytosine restriction system specificity protein McrC [Kaistella rhinocerotis]|uniref:5-methylcytosine restriction system specificity protein McrC n=1 Tax=Kaistella rhinocerotis TaxID=3026437 RepID=UPI0025528D5E|nr:hypothetical protein [Kaistella sp. Ran72]
MISLIEHFQHYRRSLDEDTDSYLRSLPAGNFKRCFQDNEEKPCCSINIKEDVSGAKTYEIETSYFIGVDRIRGLGRSIIVEPKINTVDSEVNVFAMLFEALSDYENFKHLDGLYDINFDSEPIIVHQKNDVLTPFLLIQFVQTLAALVKKGLKKSYYRTTQNLESKIKGKILVKDQINKNVLKNNKTKTFCEFEVFGFDTAQNQFLKYVLKFVKVNLNKYPVELRAAISDVFNFIQPAFGNVSDCSFTKFSTREKNPFYSEYNHLFEVGNLILKIQGFNTSNKVALKRKIPPHWIDMSMLFELYVFKKLRDIFPLKNEAIYHRKFLGGKETDIIITSDNFECVVDCKYKPRYANLDPSLEDYRQLAGYCRMKSVYKILGKPFSEVIKGLIIYSDQNAALDIKKEDLFKSNAYEYVDFFKIGIKLPEK